MAEAIDRMALTQTKSPEDEFEKWFTKEMPWMLNLSPSKQVAAELIFDGLHDFVKLIAKHHPSELEALVAELHRRGAIISKWKAPKGFYVGMNRTPGSSKPRKIYPNGKLHYVLKRERIS